VTSPDIPATRLSVVPPEGFINDLQAIDPSRFVRKWIVFGQCHVYDREHDYYSLIERVSDKFETHPTASFVVGSAKLGFSIAPKKRYLAFDENTSDIDLVIVSERLFDRVWQDFHTAKALDSNWPKRAQFFKYLFQGWLRPDFFPDVRTAVTDGWWDFFRELSKGQPAKITGAIYRNWSFFESYQSRCVTMCADVARGQIEP